MANKKSLQRFTNFDQKAKHLWSLKQITHSDLDILTKLERREYLIDVNERLTDSKGIERDNLFCQFEPIFDEETKNQCWEYNHAKITVAIEQLISVSGRMPSKVDLANKTGLSRPTIDKHLKEYASNPLYLQETEQFKFMTGKVLATVLNFAMKGDIRACKLYLEFMGSIKGGGNTYNTQNNFIQINGKIISQEAIKHLNNDQLRTIENIVKEVTEEPKLDVSKFTSEQL